MLKIVICIYTHTYYAKIIPDTILYFIRNLHTLFTIISALPPISTSPLFFPWV